ncbi:Hypothetical predicted protein [Octopus vulgaris]|uniref:Uncharacterized protein n=1 Tax=Octopus vulgaris TaxID=6645 RepID=A0AA36B6B5_OCTVU|nr:Hypothetical predicted protein [Octopus vulgaris]
MTAISAMQHLSQQALHAVEILTNLKQQLEEVKCTAMKNIMNKEEKQICRENEQLKREADEYKKKLLLAEIGNGIKQIPLLNKRNLNQISGQTISPTKEIEVKNVKAAPKPVVPINTNNKISDVDLSKLNIWDFGNVRNVRNFWSVRNVTDIPGVRDIPDIPDIPMSLNALNVWNIRNVRNI